MGEETTRTGTTREETRRSIKATRTREVEEEVGKEEGGTKREVVENGTTTSSSRTSTG